MPRLGMTMEEGTIVDWPLSVGARVRKGEIILVIETEKAETEIEATDEGILRHLFAETGETLPCGALLAVLTETAEEAFDPVAFRDAYVPPPGMVGEEKPGAGREDAPAPRAPESPRSGEGSVARKPVAPAARALSRKLGVDLDAIVGSGPKGRITTPDVEAFAARRERLVAVEPGVGLEVLREGVGSGGAGPSPEKSESVVLLPGFGTDVSSFAFQTPALTERFEVLGINPRGVAGSDAPQAAVYDVVRAAEDVAEIVDEAAHVVGASLGAAVGIEFALRHPERVRTLTLMTPFLRAGARLRAFLAAWTRVASEAEPETVATFLLPWLFGEALLDDEAARSRVQRGLAQSVKRVGRAGLEPSAAGLLAWSGSRSSQDLGSIRAPTLVLAGGADLLTPDAAEIAAAIPGATLEVIEGCGHGLSIDAAASVNRLLGEHLA